MFEVDIPSPRWISHEPETMHRLALPTDNRTAALKKPWLADLIREMEKLGYVEEVCFESNLNPIDSLEFDVQREDKADDMFIQWNCVFVLPHLKDPRVARSSCFGPLRTGYWLKVLAGLIKGGSRRDPSVGEILGAIANNSDYQLALARRSLTAQCCDGSEDQRDHCFASGLLDGNATWQYCCLWHEWYLFDVVKYGCDTELAKIKFPTLPKLCTHHRAEWRIPVP